MESETIMKGAKWASILNHVRNNRIEYLLMVGIMHIAGITTKAYAQVEGVCI